MPLEIERRIRKALAKLILPQAPPVMSEQLIFAPYNAGGPPVRVRDFVVEANAAIIRNLAKLYAIAQLRNTGSMNLLHKDMTATRLTRFDR